MPGPRRLLLLTEDTALAALLPAQLAQGTGFLVEAMAPAEGETRLAAAEGRLDAALLDAAAPPGAAHWVPRIAAAGGGRPVLLLGGDSAPPETTAWLPKPLRLADLVARLHAALASFEASPQSAITLAGFAFHPTARLMQGQDGARIRLTEKEAAILLYLHRAGDRPVPRDELLGQVWGYSSSVTTHTLETHIYRLRRKIEGKGRVVRLLVTDEGGYRLGAG
jgi:DNA-binding response OmpR family regulator